MSITFIFFQINYLTGLREFNKFNITYLFILTLINININKKHMKKI